MGRGLSKTHVANAFYEDIYVRIDGDRRYVTLESFEGKVSGEVKGVKVTASAGSKTKYDWQFAMKNGYTAIKSRSLLRFNPDTDRKTVYITILSHSGRVICHCYPKEVDFSVIVDKDGYIRETKYGCIWVDINDKRH